MTKKEKEKAIAALKKSAPIMAMTQEEFSEYIQTLNKVIDWLEQEPVLDKIRAEIKALSPEPTAYDVVDGNPVKDAVWETLIEVDKIIDKYKAECEEQE